MRFLLLNQTRSLDEWGLFHGAQFTNTDCCDALRELFLYSTRKRCNDWTISLMNRRGVHPDQELIVRTNGFETEWRIRDSSYVTGQRMLSALGIGFKENTHIQIIVTYLTCCDTLEDLYWMNVNNWYARCKTVQECTAFFNAISSNIHTIELVLERNAQCSELYFFLSEQVLREQDPIRLASMRRKMQLMKQDVITGIHL